MKRSSLCKAAALMIGLTTAAVQAAVGTLSGPFTHRNLQVFLIHGDTQLENRHYATLSEALAKGTVAVAETGNVQELSVENLSKSEAVFIHAGDIVKGGRQDRTVRDDLILPPQSGKVSLAAFCVEHGRWTRRGSENAAGFSANTKVLPSRNLRMAARYGLSQSEVWSGVADQQSKLNSNVSALAGKSVDTRSASSSSSLQLTLENKDLETITKEYLDKLVPILNGKTDVIGFVYAINGEINNAEVYNNKNLFRALWPKLLDAAVTEALTEYRRDRPMQAVDPSELKPFFTTAVSGSVQERTVGKTTHLKIHTTPTTILFETLDTDADNTWIHKNFVHKETQTLVVPLDRESRNYQPQQREPRFRQ